MVFSWITTTIKEEYIKEQQFDLTRQTGIKHKQNIEVIASLF